MICSNEIELDPLLTYFANNSICTYLHLPRTLANHTQILFCVMSVEEANDFRVLGKFPPRNWHGHTINLHYRARYAIQYYAHCYGGFDFVDDEKCCLVALALSDRTISTLTRTGHTGHFNRLYYDYTMLIKKTDKCYIDLLNDGVIVCNLALVNQDIHEILKDYKLFKSLRYWTKSSLQLPA